MRKLLGKEPAEQPDKAGPLKVTEARTSAEQATQKIANKPEQTPPGPPQAANGRVEPAVESTRSPQPVRRGERSRSVVGETMVIVGELEADEDLLIAGRLEGSIKQKDHCLTIARSGVVKATIATQSLIVEGQVEGDIECVDSVVLTDTARVTGNIKMRRVNIMDGATFNGKIVMTAPSDGD